MQSDWSWEDREAYLEVKIGPQFEMAAIRSVMEVVRQLMNDKGYKRLLIDATAFEYPLTMTERYSLGNAFADILGSDTRMVIAANPQSIHVSRMTQKVAANHGLAYHAVLDVDEAREWLLKEDKPQSF